MKKNAVSFFLPVFIFLFTSFSNASLINNECNNDFNLSIRNIPLYFAENTGQINEQVKYYSKTPHFTLWLLSDSLIFDKNVFVLPCKKQTTRDVSQLFFINSRDDVKIIPLHNTDYKINYYKGDKINWKTGINTFQAVLYNYLWLQGTD